jgi:DnaJ-domain-containing protein 1
LLAALKSKIPHSDRKWEPNGKVWLVAPQHAATLADIAEQYLGERPKVPAIQVQAQTETRLLDVRYIGSAKSRGNETTSFGWVNGQWGAIFPLAVLHEWFSVDTRPDEAPTLYAVLGVKRNVPGADLKKAYRRAARQWHPDVCNDPDAGEQFRKIDHAYKVLKDPLDRRKYDAGLQLASTVERTQQGPQKTRFGWKPPLRCGWILAEGKESLGRFVVSRILQWEDIVNAQGRTLVTSWQFGDDSFTERWV